MNFILFCLFFIFLLHISCNSVQEPSEYLKGRWLVLYPDHHLKTKSEREVYGRHQDSIVNLLGLKLISFGHNGDFFEADSFYGKPAKWNLQNENNLQITEGGKGLNPFKTEIEGFKNDTLRLMQKLPLENEKIKVVWHLKKVENDTLAQKLFSPEANAWRKKPQGPESESAIRTRLVSLLNYYSDYLKLVSKESSYFLIPRIPLPFRYYQHAIGMTADMPPAFHRLFYNDENSRKAYQILNTTVEKLANQFEWNENFVVEYSLFFKRMTYRINQY